MNFNHIKFSYINLIIQLLKIVILKYVNIELVWRKKPKHVTLIQLKTSKFGNNFIRSWNFHVATHVSSEFLSVRRRITAWVNKESMLISHHYYFKFIIENKNFSEANKMQWINKRKMVIDTLMTVNNTMHILGIFKYKYFKQTKIFIPDSWCY